MAFWSTPLGWTVITVLQILAVVVWLLLSLAFLLLADRKIWAAVQLRKGPNVVGPFGSLQSFADFFKFVFKEVIIPAGANKGVFLLAPLVMFTLAFAAWAVIPLAPGWVVSNINVGILYLFAISSVGVYGVIIAGWASNSKYAFLGAMRSAAQIVAYEIAMGFAMVGVLMAAGSLNIGEIIHRQEGLFGWNWTWLFPLFIVYFISGVAETNRAPFDVAEGESEIVAGFHVDYSGMAFALFFIAEYVNMILISTLTSVFFFGGWLSPFDGWVAADSWLAQPSFFWLAPKVFFFMFVFLWLRATFPRYRYDQIMRLGWKALIPVTLIWLLVEGVMAYGHVGPWKGYL